MNSRSIIRLFRPGQWIKNIFIFLPLFFSGNLLDIRLILHCCVAFVAFCMASSAIYSLNDIMDADYDRLHPVKRFRPVASGEISKTACVILLALLSATAVALLFLLLPYGNALPSALIIILYLLLNILYCLWLKKVSIIDVMIISFGFVLRVCIGSTSTGITPSHWIIIMTFLLALFLALSKRRDDILILKTTGQLMRQNIDKYNINFINQAITMVGTVMLVSYIIYTVSPDVTARFHSDFVYTTAIFVLLGLLRYMQLSIVFSSTGSPTKVLLHDRIIQICVIGWVATFAIIIYY